MGTKMTMKNKSIARICNSCVVYAVYAFQLKIHEITVFLQTLGHISQYLGHFCKTLHTVSTTEVYVG